MNDTQINILDKNTLQLHQFEEKNNSYSKSKLLGYDDDLK